MLRRALPYLWPYRRQWAAHLALTILVSGLQLLTPWPMKIIVDNVLGNLPLPASVTNTPLSFLAEDKIALLAAAVLAGIVLAILVGALNLWTARISIEARQAIVLEVKGELFHALQHQS